MRELIDFTGGRNLKQDDLIILQEQLTQLKANFKGLGGAFVVWGFEVTGSVGNYTVAEGVAFLNGKLIYYPGGSGLAITSSTAIREAAATTELSRAYTLDANSRDGVRKSNITIDTTAGADEEEYIGISPSGPDRNINDALRDQVYRAGMVQAWSGDIGAFDGNGVGLGSLRGWQLCNGQNSSPDMRGKFLIGRDPSDVLFDAIGDVGGSKEHDHKIGQVNPGSGVVIGDDGPQDSFITLDDTPDYQDSSPTAGIIGYIVRDRDGNDPDTWSSHGIKSHDTTALPPYYTVAWMVWQGNASGWGVFDDGAQQQGQESES